MIVGHGANSMTMEEARAKLCAEAKYVSCLIFCFLDYSGLFFEKNKELNTIFLQSLYCCFDDLMQFLNVSLCYNYF